MADFFNDGFGTDLLNAGLSLINARANRNFAREQATTAYNRQLSLMDRMNEYNTPSNQVKRLVEAGLNPNLAYGQLDLSGVSAPSVPQGEAVPQQAVQLHLQNALAASQIENMNANTDIKRQEAEADIKKKLSEIFKNEKEAERVGVLIDNDKATLREIEQRILNMSTQRRYTLLDIAYKSAIFDDAVNILHNQADMSYAEARQYAEYLQARMLNLRSGTRLNNSLASQADKQAALYNQEFEQNEWYWDNTYSLRSKSISLEGKSQNLADKTIGLSLDFMNKYGSTQKTMGLLLAGSQLLGNLTSSAADLSRFIPGRKFFK